jgi:hypothetical protein
VSGQIDAPVALTLEKEGPRCPLKDVILTPVHQSLSGYWLSSIRHAVSSFIHSSMALQPFVVPWPLLQFRNFFTQTIRLLGRMMQYFWALGFLSSPGMCLHSSISVQLCLLKAEI